MPAQSTIQMKVTLITEVLQNRFQFSPILFKMIRENSIYFDQDQLRSNYEQDVFSIYSIYRKSDKYLGILLACYAWCGFNENSFTISISIIFLGVLSVFRFRIHPI